MRGHEAGRHGLPRCCFAGIAFLFLSQSKARRGETESAIAGWNGEQNGDLARRCAGRES
jgi:hypothetical protein